MKKIVGIVPSAKLFATDDYYADNYIFVNNYIKRVAENGGTPVGVLSNDGYVSEDTLSACDSFLICGGARIWPYHFQTVEHAVNSRKPLLGICLGLQAIWSYFTVLEEAEKRGFQGNALDLYDSMKKEGRLFTVPVEHHWDVPMTRNHISETKHRINLIPDTRTQKLLGSDTVMGASMHRYRVNGASGYLTVSGRADDYTVEALEYEDFLLGVQFHPEVEREFDALFRTLTETD